VKTFREALIASYEKRDGHSLKHTHPEHADAALSALRQWLADNWLVVVPRDATPTMSHAGESYMETMDDDAYAQDVWHNMIAAAPDALETKP
jgi:hypothetical protein